MVNSPVSTGEALRHGEPGAEEVCLELMLPVDGQCLVACFLLRHFASQQPPGDMYVNGPEQHLHSPPTNVH